MWLLESIQIRAVHPLPNAKDVNLLPYLLPYFCFSWSPSLGSSMIAAVFLFSSYHELTKSGNFFQCKKHLTADRMQQCKEEPNTPVMFRDMMVLQINATDFAFNGKIEFVEAVGAPWKVQYVMNIVYVILWTDSSKWIFSISRKHGLLH